MKIETISTRARPKRSPNAPKINPPTAQPTRKKDVVYDANSVARALLATRSSTAPSRDRLKTCWSRQSKSQAREATAKIYQCWRVNVRHQACVLIVV